MRGRAEAEDSEDISTPAPRAIAPRSSLQETLPMSPTLNHSTTDTREKEEETGTTESRFLAAFSTYEETEPATALLELATTEREKTGEEEEESSTEGLAATTKEEELRSSESTGRASAPVFKAVQEELAETTEASSTEAE